MEALESGYGWYSSLALAGVVTHYELAEKMAHEMCYTGALVHAVLALVDRLEDMPVMGLEVSESEDDV